MNTNNIDDLFKKFDGQWDVEEPATGHQDRFLDRLERKNKKKFSFKLLMPVAAAILILFGVFMSRQQEPATQNTMAKVSPEVRETQIYFASIIKKELAKVEKENSPETQKLVKDALTHMEELERDYNKLTQELIKKGENKQIIHAMITNLQTRISFLEEVLTRIENTKKLKEKYHESNQA